MTATTPSRFILVPDKNGWFKGTATLRNSSKSWPDTEANRRRLDKRNRGTWYNGNGGLGACGTPINDNLFYVALVRQFIPLAGNDGECC